MYTVYKEDGAVKKKSEPWLRFGFYFYRRLVGRQLDFYFEVPGEKIVDSRAVFLACSISSSETSRGMVRRCPG